MFVCAPRSAGHAPLRRTARILPPLASVINAAYSSHGAAAPRATRGTADAEAVAMATADWLAAAASPLPHGAGGPGRRLSDSPGAAVVTRCPWQRDTTAVGRGCVCLCVCVCVCVFTG